MTNLLPARRSMAIPVPALALAGLLLLLFASPASSWEYSEFSADAEGRLAMMGRAGLWNPYLEVKGTFHGDQMSFRYHSVTAGTYLRAAGWLKVGAFYRLQGGVRHLEDWIVIDNPSPIPDEHRWAGVSGRYENLLLLDATPRFRVDRLPGDWVAAAKIRYGSNFRNGHQTLLLRPGITWTAMRDRRPVVNLGLAYPLYFALNFGDAALYGHGPYLTVLGHLKDWMKLEGRVEYLMKTYAKTEHGGPWILNSRHLVIGLGVVFTPDFIRR